nr:M20 family metallopeptidase [uncultured Cetobacterium sp.]
MLKKIVNKNRDYIIKMRREFHEFPEPSFQEFRTSQRIQEELESMGIPYKVAARTGVVATINGKAPGKTIALRADIDALQVTECNTVDYTSKNIGIMHACGHDGHAAMLLGAAKSLNEIKDLISGTIKLYFQPAEEIGAGALKMLEEEPLDNVDGCFAIHLWSDLPCGKVSVEGGPRMASADIFKITIDGKGGHGSLPHQTIDAVVVGSAVVMNLQSIVSRELSPLESNVVTVGSFHSGTRFNVIANQAILEGTTRTFNLETRENFKNILERVTNGTCDSYRATGKVEYTYGTAPSINDYKCSELAEKTVENLLGKDGVAKMEKITGGEDFCYFLQQVPGVLAFVGARNEEKEACYPHHHEKFNIDEDALEIGATLYAQFALDFLNN